MTPNGTPVILSNGPAAGWGLVAGIDVNHSPETYGPASPGLNHYRWATTPNPGGLPMVGNASFSLTLYATPGFGITSSFYMVSHKAAQIALPSVTLLLGGTLVGPFRMPNPVPSATIPLPIPNNPTLLGLQAFHLQSFHFEGVQLAASDRVSFQIM